MIKSCRACGESYRKGTIAFVIKNGKLVAGRVCPSCAKQGVTIIGLEATSRCKCGKKPTTCGSCAVDTERSNKASDLASAVKKLRAMVSVYKTSPVARMSEHAIEMNDGRIEGLESAIELLESGRY